MRYSIALRSENCLFNTSFSAGDGVFSVEFGRVTDTTANPYTGSYELWPGIDDATLATREKLMRDDVTLYAIPRQTVENPAGGRTITIGG